jgi:hypothetical protein
MESATTKSEDMAQYLIQSSGDFSDFHSSMFGSTHYTAYKHSPA